MSTTTITTTRRSLLTSAALFFFALALPLAHADDVGEARRAIQALYDQIDAAIVRKDSKAAYAPYAPGHVTTHNGERMTVPQMRRSMEDVLDGAKYIRSTTVMDRFALRGRDEAVVTVRGAFRASLYESQTDARALVTMNAVSRDVWRRNARGKWLLQNSKVISLRMTRNGKPVPAS